MTPDSSPRPSRHRTSLVVFLLLALVVAVAGTPWPARHFGLADAAGEVAARQAGLELRAMQGEAMVRLLPSPRLIVKGPRFAGPGMTLTAGELELRMGASLLLPAGPRIGRAILTAPTVTFDGSVPGEPLQQMLRLLTHAAELPTLVVRDGTWSEPAGRREARDINLSLVGSRGDEALRLNAMIGDQRISLAAGLAPPSGATPGAARLSIDSAPLSLAFQGEASLGSSQLVTGQFRLALDRPERLGGWLDPTLQEIVSGKLVVSGVGRLRREGFQLNDAIIESPIGTFSGTLAGRLDAPQRPSLSGTLHIPVADFRAFAFASSGIGSGSSLPPLARLLALADIDLRVSARRIMLAEQPMEDAAVSLQVRNGRIEGSVGETRLGRGVLRGRFALQENGAGTDFRTQGQWDRVDLKAIAGERLLPHAQGGQTSGQFQLETHGHDLPALVANLSGRVTALLADAETQAFDLTRLSQRPPRAAQPGVGRAVQGRGNLDQMQAVLKVASGRLEIGEAFVRSGNTRAALGGNIDLASGLVAVDIAVPLARIDPAGRLAGRLLVRGDWRRPSYGFEPGETGDTSLVIAP